MLFIIDKYPNEYYEFLRKMPKNYSKCEIVSEGIISTTATVDFTRGLETDVRTFTDFLSDIPESDMRKFQNGNNDNKQFNSILIHNQKTFLKIKYEFFSFQKQKINARQINVLKFIKQNKVFRGIPIKIKDLSIGPKIKFFFTYPRLMTPDREKFFFVIL